MRAVDVIVVGGGPAGSSCARQLVAAGLDVVVLDKTTFPRTKLCAGWVTPETLQDLELDPNDYPGSFLTFDALKLHWKFFSAAPASQQHSIRRYEFDDFLLRRSGATILQHKVVSISRDGDGFRIDDRFRCRYLVGAGGTACPVYRTFFQDRQPRNRLLQTATLEQEFAYDWQDPACHLWFFDGGLPGYAWYVPKANGYVNIGLGGMAERLKRRNGHLREHWRRFVTKLSAKGLVCYPEFAPKGYSYYLRDGIDASHCDNAYVVGDAAGLATRDMCEGIGPAVKSGLLAARSIIESCDYSLADISHLTGGGIASSLLERAFAGADRLPDGSTGPLASRPA